MIKNFKLNITTPKGNFYNGDVEIFTLKIAEGYIGFLVNHAPLTSIVQPSKFSIKTSNTKIEGIIGNGVVMMTGDEATVVVTNIVEKSQLNKSEAKLKSKDVENELGDPEILPYKRKMLEKEKDFYDEVINYA